MIRLDAIDLETVEVVPEVRLADAWGSYQAAIKAAGARNRKLPDGRWQTTAPLARAAEIEAALRHLGLTVSVGPGLAAIRDQEVARPDQLALVDEIERETGMRLYGFQREGVGWLAKKTRALLLDEMGIGKSCQALMSLPEGARTLVVCPAAVKAVWRREAARFRPELEVSVLRHRGSFRWPEPGELVVTNFELLPEIVPEGCPDGVVLIADEAHAFKSFKAQRTRRFRALGATVRAKGGRTWLLTGTPLTNRPPDLWGVLQAAGLAEVTFGSWPHFAELFGGYQKEVKLGVRVWFWGRPNGPEVSGRLRAVSLRRHKADVLDLPPKSREVLRETDLAARDRKALDRVYEAIEAAGLGADEEGRRTLPAFEGMSEARALLAACKLPLLEAIVESHEEASEPLVVWSAHRAPVEAIGRRPGWGLLTGDVSLDERARLVESFQAGQLVGLACTIAAAGVGLTMTRAAHEVFVDLDWTPALNEQAEDRLHRISQDRPVLVTVLAVDHPLEDRILELCEWKRGIFSETVGASASFRAAIPDAQETERRAAERQFRRPRPARTDAERWAEAALLTLSGLDPDGARALNGAGWNRVDGPFGHRLAEKLAGRRSQLAALTSGSATCDLRPATGLSDAQWAAAVRMCRKYRRQVGECPAEGDGRRATVASSELGGSR